MYIIQRNPNPSGAYPAPQSWNSNKPPVGYVLIPDTVDMTAFYEHNGFVTLTIEDDKVTSYAPNIEAWEAWKAELPTIVEEEAPTQLDRIEAQVTYTAMMTDTLLEEE